MSLGERIKHAREAKGLTLKDVAIKIGVSEATVQRYESGAIKNPKQPSLKKLAHALGVDINYLMDWNGSGVSNQPYSLNHINEDLEDIIRIYNSLGRQQRHELMAKAYELEKEIKRKGR